MDQTEDLKQLLRRKGKTQSDVGLSQAYVSMIVNGRRQAGPDAIASIAEACGCSTDEVCAACDESYRRAQVGDLAAVPTPSAPSVTVAPTEA